MDVESIEDTRNMSSVSNEIFVLLDRRMISFFFFSFFFVTKTAPRSLCLSRTMRLGGKGLIKRRTIERRLTLGMSENWSAKINK